MRQITIIGLTTLAALLASCASNTPPGGGSPNGAADTTPPTVLSVTPASGAAGVTADAVITVTFSEAMDRAATAAAYSSTDLSAGSVTFEWNAAGTILTIRPKNPLAYKHAVGLVEPPLQYSFGFTAVARDVAGNSLAAFNSNFTTLRFVPVVLFSQAALDGTVTSDGAVDTTNGLIFAGDQASNVSNRAFLSFDLSSIPASTNASAVQAATLEVRRSSMAGTPFTSLMAPCTGQFCPTNAPVQLSHVSYGASLGWLAYGTVVLQSLGVFDSIFLDYGWRSADVLSAVQSDLMNRAIRGNRSQYRLSFPLASDADNSYDNVGFSSGDHNTWAPKLNITLLIP